jgi:hypothetical protein
VGSPTPELDGPWPPGNCTRGCAQGAGPHRGHQREDPALPGPDPCAGNRLPTNTGQSNLARVASGRPRPTTPGSRPPLRQDRFARNSARSHAATRTALLIRTLLSAPEPQIRYTVAVQTRSTAATSRAVRRSRDCKSVVSRLLLTAAFDAEILASARHEDFNVFTALIGFANRCLHPSSPSEAEGSGFESRRAHSLISCPPVAPGGLRPK